jgi:UDP-N-acetylglucosamine 2-epimerase (non-hydrolysing)
MNRVVASHLSTMHFAPTESSKSNLLLENIPEDAIHVTGNTVIDALLMTAEKDIKLDIALDHSKRLVLMTSHRRENFGTPMREAFSAVRELVERNSDVEVVYPVHPNPNVTKLAYGILGDHKRIKLIQPLDYAPFVQIMKRSFMIISDSGGVQEEAPALGKPVLVLRKETERPEAVEAGVVKLVGTNRERILSETEKLLNDDDVYREMARGVSPYGDGRAAARITNILKQWAY